MSEEALAGWALLVQAELTELLARVAANLGISTAQCLEQLTPREFFLLSEQLGSPLAALPLGESPLTDSQLAGFFR